MNGILSARPGQGAVRLLVGAHGLLLTQSLLLLAAGDPNGIIRPLTLIVTILAGAASLVAVIGDGVDHDRPWRHRDGR